MNRGKMNGVLRGIIKYTVYTVAYRDPYSGWGWISSKFEIGKFTSIAQTDLHTVVLILNLFIASIDIANSVDQRYSMLTFDIA